MRRQAIAVIPARGGSKRIPRKNIIDFFGRPLIAWTIQAAQESGAFDRVLVSTDDEDIATIAHDWGAEAPFLRLAEADDHAPVSLATIAALAQASAHFAESYDIVVQLMPNCPLRGAAEIQDALAAFAAGDAAFQISCFAFGWMNPWWAVQLDHRGRPEYLFKERTALRSQDLPTLHCPSGAIWVARSDRLHEAGTFYGPDHVFHPMDWQSAVDIDTYEDLAFARAVYMSRQSGPSGG